MRRWLNMIAAGQPVRRLVLDAGLHAVAGLVDVLPDMRRRMATVRLAVPSKPPPMFIAAGLSDPVAPDSQRLEQALLRACSRHAARTTMPASRMPFT